MQQYANDSFKDFGLSFTISSRAITAWKRRKHFIFVGLVLGLVSVLTYRICFLSNLSLLATLHECNYDTVCFLSLYEQLLHFEN